MVASLMFAAPIQLGAKRSRPPETSPDLFRTMQGYLRPARLSPSLPQEWSGSMDEIQKFPFAEPGCEHFPLLVYLSCVLILF